MSSIQRIATVYKKDVYWVLGNFKLLGIMLMPILFIIFFSQTGKGALFSFIMVFINAFIGIFSTSYLIIEEKNKGTLLSLLTTPLKSFELLLAKFFFNLTLCLLISLLAIVVNSRLDLLVSPYALINLALYAGLTCFVGCVVGMFFKNEQEMSIVAPILMFFFIFGDIVAKTASGSAYFPFFPDYHITQVIKNPMSLDANYMPHTFFNLLYFLIALVSATLYTQFYFSNNRETRVSKTLIGMIGFFTLALMVSALINKDESRQRLDPQGRVSQRFVSKYWSGRFEFDGNLWEMQKILDTTARSVFVMHPSKQVQQNKSGRPEGIEMSIALRPAEKEESTKLKRYQLFRKDPRRELLSYETIQHKTHEFQKFIYFHEEKLIILLESFCSEQLLQISLDVESKGLTSLQTYWMHLQNLLDNLHFTCSRN